MEILIHICCGPCGTYSVKSLQDSGYNVKGYFYNPNIHPYLEFKKRLESAAILADKYNIELLYDDNYGLLEFTRMVSGKEDKKRCIECFRERMVGTALKAKNIGINKFTTSLFISPYQPQNLIIKAGNEAAEQTGLEFLYFNFSKGYRDSIEYSKNFGMYRQKYCGCIFSEYERFAKTEIII